MPKKRRLSQMALDRVARQLEETRKSLHSTSRSLNRHFKLSHKLVRRANAFHELFSDFEDMCRRELGITAHSGRVG